MMTRSKPVSFGILGAGRIALNAMAPAIRAAAGAELAAVASRDITRARSAGPNRAYDRYEDLLDDEEVDAVYVATHNGLHHPLTLAALEHGKHVMCEKPLACNAAQAEEMAAAARRYDRLLVEAFMYRHHPRLLRTKSLLHEGAIGEIARVEASFSFLMSNSEDVRWSASWGGGALLDVGCYCVNVCRYLFGSEPIAVVALGCFHPQQDIDTSLHGVMDFGCGRFGIVSCGFDGGLRNCASAVGPRGTIDLPDAFANSGKPTTLVVDAAGKRAETAFEPVDVFRLQVEDFVRAIQTGSSALLPLDDGVRNARVLDALLESARQDGRRVAISAA